MRTLLRTRHLLPVLCSIGLVTVSTAALSSNANPTLHRELTLNGEFVHDVGEIQLHVTNFGLIGSQPGASCSFCDAPSAMWPAGSGVDHLYGAGIWIGARLDGQPRVTTAARGGTELRADAGDPRDTIYEGSRGALHGARYPDPDPDDDGDGLEDEDPLNGRDDDGDGAIDEDFAGISNQAFRTELADDHATILESNPEHVPLHLEVVQESFAWSDPAVDGVVGFEFTIRASESYPADRVLEDVYVGFFADPDIGLRGSSAIASDDLPGYHEGSWLFVDGHVTPLRFAYAYDEDGDAGVSPGFFGVALADHTTDPLGLRAPTEVGVRGFQQFSGSHPFLQGGDPTNDAERYDLLSREEFDSFPLPGQNKANDYRILLSAGPFPEFRADDEIVVRWIVAVGAGFDGMSRAIAEGCRAAEGRLFDRDGDPSNGAEYRVPWLLGSEVPVSIDEPSTPDADVLASSRSQLLPNVPNPFNPSTTIHFRLPRVGTVDLSIHDAAGRRVRSIHLGVQDAGPGHWIWNGLDDAGRRVSSGTYLVRLKSEHGIDARRLLLVK